MIPCIIPARGGSKGIPRKNLLPIGGKPLLRWSIEHALGAELVDQVIVATEDEEIAECARNSGYLGVTIYPRSAESAADDAPLEKLLTEIVSEHWFDAEMVVVLQPTSPVRRAGDVDSAITLFRDMNADSMFSARHIEGYTWDASGRVLAPRDGPRQPRQQEIRNIIEENGSLYIFRPAILLDHGSRLGGRIVPYMMDVLESVQLDRTEDVAIVEEILELRRDPANAG